ncbi:MAG TPA: circadian clock protein KaiB [Candidatus Riflebacteria bacterium]|jgi:circadian clock protein KaiB|nr:circadian clock protein KaiB [Candidatus Riflebacteria bacterium]
MNQPVEDKWILKLYIAGMTPTARRALANLQAICEEHMAGSYSLEVIDLVENPTLEDGEQIFAVPTLVRQLPPPLRKIIGDFSNTEKVLVGLDVKPRSQS